MKSILKLAIAIILIAQLNGPAYAKSAEDQGHYLQKILLVVDSPDTGQRLRYENALKTQAHLYTPRVDTLVSSPLMPDLKMLSKEKDLNALAAEQKVDGVLVIENITTTTRDVEACPSSRGGDITTHIVDTLLTKCPIVHIPKVTCMARLHGVSPYQEIWHLEASFEGTAKDPKTPDKLFNDLSIKFFKAIQRDKFILPSKFQR